MRTLQRQHQITLKRLERIEKRVEEGAYETPPSPTTLSEWFRDLLGLSKSKEDRDGTGG